MNPYHLSLGTKKDNTTDMRIKGRARGGSSPGDSNPDARLTWSQVVEIRRRWEAEGGRPGRKGAKGTKRLLAEEFSVSTTAIGFIVSGKHWRRDMARAKVQAGGIIRKSLANDWRTPGWLLDRVRIYFGGEQIPFDPSSAPDNPTKAETFLYGAPGTMFEQQTGKNGLMAEWPLRGTYCNPPYGSELRAWLIKFSQEARRGCEIVALLPTSRWETDYLHDVLTEAHVVCFIRGRVAFVSAVDGVPVPGNCSGSMLLGFNVDPQRWAHAFAEIGLCLSYSPMGSQ